MEAKAAKTSHQEDKLITGGFENFLIAVLFLDAITSFPHQYTHLTLAIVFTHGDLGPDNIAVETRDNEWVVTGLIDWKYSGFYPEYCEAVRCTNCLAP